MCSGPHKTWDRRCKHKKKKLKRINTVRENKPYRYEVKPPSPLLFTNIFPFAIQAGSSTAPPIAGNKRTATESQSLSPVKNTPSVRETHSSTSSSSQAPNRIPLAAINRNHKGRKKINNKVQVFEQEEPEKIPDTPMNNPESNYQSGQRQDDEL